MLCVFVVLLYLCCLLIVDFVCFVRACAEHEGRPLAEDAAALLEPRDYTILYYTILY